jgi:hypothetical protein
MGCRYICKPELRDTTVDAIQAVAVKIEDKKLMSRILPALPSDSSLAHCRRVHNGFILIGAMDDAEKQSRFVV